jgi:hypothetical protein
MNGSAPLSVTFSKQLQNFYRQTDICQQFITVYTSQHNELAEIKNHTILDIVQTMLTKKGICQKVFEQK